MPTDAVQPLLSLFILFVAAKLGEEAFVELGQPGLIGQIIAGFIVGPGLLSWVHASAIVDFMAEVGVIFLLFETGLHTKPEDITEHGYTSMAVGFFGVLTPLAAGWAFAWAIGENPITARFVGTLLTATSIGITAKILSDFRATETAFGRVILGAAVLDDILGLLALSMLSSFATGVSHWANLLLTVVFVSLFFVLVLLLRRKASPGIRKRLGRMRSEAPQWSFALVVVLGFSVMSAYIGVAAIIGSFLAGIFVSESDELAAPLRLRAEAVSSFVVPFFLANIGLKLSPDVLTQSHDLFLIAAITLIAIVTKLVACGLSALPLGRRSALLVGLGMIPRGEVGIVVADQSLRIAAIPAAYYSIGIAMAVLTTLIGPLLLRLVIRPARTEAGTAGGAPSGPAAALRQFPRAVDGEPH
ncbi:MAG TPA: cation:proton antiporter [Terriglobales bacterium]|jgi:Kef-type K+ transport system membrane component KefB